MRARCGIYFLNVFFLIRMSPFFQEIMNRCISAKGKKELMGRLVPGEQRDLSLCRPHQTQESWAETCKMPFLFNRCHIIVKTLETRQARGFFPFLRLQIGVVCVLSLLYKSTVNVDMSFVQDDALKCVWGSGYLVFSACLHISKKYAQTHNCITFFVIFIQEEIILHLWVFREI